MRYLVTLLILLMTACSTDMTGAFPTGLEQPGCEDADGDGFFDKACGGNDCCDIDSATHPHAAASDIPSACGGYDLDCNGKEEPDIGAGRCQSVGSSCSFVPGFLQQTACGEWGSLVKSCVSQPGGGCFYQLEDEQQVCS